MKIFKEKILLIFSIVSGLLLLFSLGLIYFSAPNLTTPLVIHFDSFRGIDFFGEIQHLWFIWLTGFIMTAINIFFGWFFFYRERVLSYLFFGTNVLIAILVLIIVGTIISVN